VWASKCLKKNNTRFGKFLCDCGKEKEAPICLVKRNSPMSCGCLNSSRRPWGEAAQDNHYLTWKSDERIRHKKSLSKEDFNKLVHSDCYYCGQKPNQISTRKKYFGIPMVNGIDRIDNSKGYVKDNCVPCCSNCNFAKHVKTQKEFIEMCHKVAKLHPIETKENPNELV